jgi:hypothetical protein
MLMVKQIIVAWWALNLVSNLSLLAIRQYIWETKYTGSKTDFDVFFMKEYPIMDLGLALTQFIVKLICSICLLVIIYEVARTLF